MKVEAGVVNFEYINLILTMELWLCAKRKIHRMGNKKAQKIYVEELT